jgi:hypothetical protein
MSQIIACRNDEGIILAADSGAIDADSSNNIVDLKINRLLQLSANAAILTGGATEGEKMCRALKEFVSAENLTDIDEVYNAALPFLASEYEHFMRKKCAYWPIDPIHQVFFILGGYSKSNAQNPFQLHLLWTKMKLPQLDGDEISSAYTVPRLIRLEYRLNQLSKNQTPLDDLLAEVRSYLEKQAAADAEISEPLTFAVITRDGFREIE